MNLHTKEVARLPLELHYEDLHNVHLLPDIVRKIKL